MQPLKSLLLTGTLLFAGCAQNNSYLEKKNLYLGNQAYSVENNKLTQISEKTNQIAFGVVSDIHNEPIKAKKIADKLMQENVDAIVVTGDMAKTLPMPFNLSEKKHIRDSLIPFLETGKPIYVIAGNHETRFVYKKTMKQLAEDYDNLFDLATLKYADLNGVNLFGVSGGYPGPIGNFSLDYALKKVDKAVFSLDKDPVLMISHMPPRFNHPGAIDCVYDVLTNDGKIIKNRHKGEKVIEEGNGKKLNSQNKGEQDLTDLILEGDISFSVSGHYHMNQGANDFSENIPQNILVYRLFMNPGAAKYDMAGILTIKGEKAKYELLKIN